MAFKGLIRHFRALSGPVNPSKLPSVGACPCNARISMIMASRQTMSIEGLERLFCFLLAFFWFVLCFLAFFGLIEPYKAFKDLEALKGLIRAL